MTRSSVIQGLLMLAMVAFLGHLAAQAAPGGSPEQQIEYYKQQRALGQYTACKSNLKNLGTALEMWSTDNRGAYPTRLAQLSPSYLRVIPSCPAAGRDTYSASYTRTGRGYQVMCQGTNHAPAGIGANYPRYDSERGLTAPESPIRRAPSVSGPGGYRVGAAFGCKSNLKNIGTSLEMWSTDNRGQYPTRLQQVAPNYLRRIPTCPAAGRDTYSGSYQATRKPATYVVGCQGNNHRDEGYPANFPRYTSEKGIMDR